MIHENIELTGSFSVTGSLTLPNYPSSASYLSPTTGSMYNDTGLNVVRFYDGVQWQTLVSGSVSESPAGPASADIEYLLVAGGGGGGGGASTGGYTGGGGGGAGGYLSSSLSSVESGSSFTVTIGAGGSGGPWTTTTTDNKGSDGADSSIAGSTISTITATGGGAGGAGGANGTGFGIGEDGGSGGGSGYRSTTAGSGTTGQGNDGGHAGSGEEGSGGGGGASQAGQDGYIVGSDNYWGGDGGSGSLSSITGTSTFYAGGGAAGGLTLSGYNNNTPGSGGPGGGGDGGGNAGLSGAAGTTNTGGGGGGGSRDETTNTGGTGGSGVAIFAYDSGSINAAGGIVGDAGNGRKYHQFNSSDTFKVGSTSDFQIVTDSLEVHLDAAHFDSRGTSTWTDLSGNGYNATAANSPTLNNYDYTLNGTSQEFTINISGITWGGSASIEGWVKLDTATPANGAQTGLWTFDGSSTSSITHYPYTNGSAYFSTFRNTRLGPITLSASVTRTDWHHIVITSESGGNWVLYQNATAVYTTTADQTTIDTGVTNYIGRSISGDGGTQDRRLDGNIGQFRLYSKALSAAEVLQNYNATKTNFV